MIKDILTYPDPLLRKIAKSVDGVDDEIRALLEDMADSMFQDDGVGLAAPQIGVSLRAIVVTVKDFIDPGKSRIIKMVNPEITSREGEIEMEEGCLSVPDFRICIKRSNKITVTYIDENGTAFICELEGLPAVIAQHEIDHLDGRLIIDYAGRVRRDMYERKIKRIRSKA